jgi:hypothetical protein
MPERFIGGAVIFGLRWWDAKGCLAVATRAIGRRCAGGRDRVGQGTFRQAAGARAVDLANTCGWHHFNLGIPTRLHVGWERLAKSCATLATAIGWMSLYGARF